MKHYSVSTGTPEVHSFFDPATYTISHIVVDPTTKKTAIIDSVLDYDQNAGKVSYESADKLIRFVKEQELEVEWILETHAHADHLSAAVYLQDALGGKIGIGEHIHDVQKIFGKVFNIEEELKVLDRSFDTLFKDGDIFPLGSLEVEVIHSPGHTPADLSYRINDTVFVGDTLFMPDYGTARCDFPGGDAGTLYDSIQKLFELPEDTRVFLCHDYLPEGRDEYQWQTTIKEEKEKNIHVGKGTKKEDFVYMRTQRDKNLAVPKLLIPSIQVNVRGGNLPEAESNEIRYIKVPINTL